MEPELAEKYILYDPYKKTKRRGSNSSSNFYGSKLQNKSSVEINLVPQKRKTPKGSLKSRRRQSLGGTTNFYVPKQPLNKKGSGKMKRPPIKITKPLNTSIENGIENSKNLPNRSRRNPNLSLAEKIKLYKIKAKSREKSRQQLLNIPTQTSIDNISDKSGSKNANIPRVERQSRKRRSSRRERRESLNRSIDRLNDLRRKWKASASRVNSVLEKSRSILGTNNSIDNKSNSKMIKFTPNRDKLNLTLGAQTRNRRKSVIPTSNFLITDCASSQIKQNSPVNSARKFKPNKLLASPELRQESPMRNQLNIIKITKAILPKSDSVNSETFWDQKNSQFISKRSSDSPKNSHVKLKNEIIRNIENVKKSLPGKKTNVEKELNIIKKIKNRLLENKVNKPRKKQKSFFKNKSKDKISTKLGNTFGFLGIPKAKNQPSTSGLKGGRRRKSYLNSKRSLDSSFTAGQKEENDRMFSKKVDQKFNLSRSKSKGSRNSILSVEQVQHQTYYMKALEYYLSVKKQTNRTARLYQEHFIESIAALKYIRRLRMPSDQAMLSIRLNCANINSTKKNCKYSYCSDTFR